MQRYEEENRQFAEVSLANRSSNSALIRRKWFWMVLLLLAVVIVAVLLLIKRPDSAKDVDESKPANQSSSDHSPGSEVVLYLEGRKTVMVAVDEQSLDELVTALAKTDRVEQLVDAGKVFSVPTNTKVRVVEANFTKLKVRFLEG